MNSCHLHRAIYKQRLLSSFVVSVFLLYQIIVTVWRQEVDNVEVKEHGYRTLLQLKSPGHIFRQDLSTFKTQGTRTHIHKLRHSPFRSGLSILVLARQ